MAKHLRVGLPVAIVTGIVTGIVGACLPAPFGEIASGSLSWVGGATYMALYFQAGGSVKAGDGT